MGYERVRGHRRGYRPLKIAFAAAALLGDSERRLEECSNELARFGRKWVRRGDASADSCLGNTQRRMRPRTRAMSGNVASDFVREEGECVGVCAGLRRARFGGGREQI
jgi:hypothetical protein